MRRGTKTTADVVKEPLHALSDALACGCDGGVDAQCCAVLAQCGEREHALKHER